MQPRADQTHVHGTPGGGWAFRELAGEQDLAQCVSLQRATWGDDFRELVPPAMLTVAQKVGGVLLGAFGADGELIGFVFGLTGILDGRPVHWSHMLAVHPAWRDRGLGQALKQRQRERLLSRGIDRALWTFDPLVARNANLNLNRLRARILDYVPDMYGVNPMSSVDAVIGTDRFLVEWLLAEIGQAPISPIADAPTITLIDDPARDATLPPAPRVLLCIPDDIQDLKVDDPETARAWRQLTRRVFTHYLTTGYRVTGFRRSPGKSAYVIERADA